MAPATPRSFTDVPDILYHVFSQLAVPFVWYKSNGNAAIYESRRSLAMLARTCRVFTDPALKVLWSSLPDDQPLADLLCHLGIATREQGAEDRSTRHDKRPERYHLPTNEVFGYYRPGALDEYEHRWKRSRGFNVNYVRIPEGWDYRYDIVLIRCYSLSLLQAILVHIPAGLGSWNMRRACVPLPFSFSTAQRGPDYGMSCGL